MEPQSSDLGRAIAQAAALHRGGHFAQAEQLCRAILRVRPQEPTTLHVLGACLMQRGEYAAAEAALAACVQVQPNQPAVLMNHGIALHALRRFEEALACYSQAATLKSDDGYLAWYRARALAALHRDREALDEYGRAAAVLGQQSQLLTEQLRVANRMLENSPRDRHALAARAVTLANQRHWRKAYEDFGAWIAHFPDDLDAMTGMAGVCLRLDRPGEALAACDAVLQHRPREVGVLGNKAAALAQLGNYVAALRELDAALALDPNDAGLRWNRALYHLVQGRFADAWPDFEWRWKRSSYLQWLRSLPEQLWDGTADLAGKTILLHSEQGFGDAIQFARYAPLLAAQGARVIVGAHAPLRPVLATIDSVSAVIVNGDEMPAVDFHCPLMSLPALLGTNLETIPSDVPYVRSDATLAAQWAQRLGPAKRMRVGLAWAGSPTHEEDARRSIPLSLLEPLLAVPGEFHCLTRDIRDGDSERMQRWGVGFHGHELPSFSETAALIQSMDLVISVDTSIAHLAGALAKPLWLLISDPPEWRWMIGRSDSPWYPTARLFRQRDRGNWAEVIARVRLELTGMVAATPGHR